MRLRTRHRAGAPAATDRAILPRRRHPEPAKNGTGLGLAIVKSILSPAIAGD